MGKETGFPAEGLPGSGWAVIREAGGKERRKDGRIRVKKHSGDSVHTDHMQVSLVKEGGGKMSVGQENTRARTGSPKQLNRLLADVSSERKGMWVTLKSSEGAGEWV